MRGSLLLALGAVLLAGSALAQATHDRENRPVPQAGTRSGADAAASRGGSESRSPGPPLDRGPFTPEANQAHRGGGAVLEGAPGAPAPPPLPTPAHDPPQSR